MINPQTGEAEDLTCSVADMEVLKQQGWVHTLYLSKIVSGRDTSGAGGGHGTSDAWKDTLRRIKANNPGSDIDI